MQTTDKKILSRIYGKKRGWVFTPRSFLDIGSVDAVKKALSRFAAKGTIRRIARGLYDYPKTHPKLGVLSPSTDAIVSALKDRDGVRVMPTGAYAANLLGLSTQVPMRIAYLTDGKGRKVEIGNRTIELKNTSPRNMATSDRVSGLVIQALRSIGKDHVDDSTVKILRGKLSMDDRKSLLKDIHYAPGWMGALFREVAAD